MLLLKLQEWIKNKFLHNRFYKIEQIVRSAAQQHFCDCLNKDFINISNDIKNVMRKINEKI